MNYSAAIPVHQGAATLGSVVSSLRGLNPAPDEVLVIDDGSSDATMDIARSTGARAISLGRNLGRGAARARAIAECRTPLLLMCDATLQPCAQFVERALPWFLDERVAAVFANVAQGSSRSVAARWRGRHLFKSDQDAPLNTTALLATGVSLLRRKAVEEVGGFSPTLRSGEDADLGRRLLAAGWKVVTGPGLNAWSLTEDTATSVLRRYARWNSPQGLGFRSFIKQMAYAMKVMVRCDLRAGDPAAAVLSLASPFYQLRSR